MSSPLLELPGAVDADALGVAAHYGSFNTEQRTLSSGEGFVDLSHLDVLRISGEDRLTLLHSLTSQKFDALLPGEWVSALVLSPQGRIEHGLMGVDDGEAFTAWTADGPGLTDFLLKMRFMMRVEVETSPLAAVWRPSGWMFVEPDSLTALAQAASPCGLWAFEALRIARGEAWIGVDTDHRTIPNEIGLLGVHLDKGCYRGQETVARVHTLGRPPRRLVMLHLDGSENRLPARGSELLVGDKAVGFVGSSARHFELGPIALGLIKRNVALDAPVMVDSMPATQEVVVDPEVGLHVRPKLG